MRSRRRLSPARAKIAATVERGTWSRTAMVHAVKRWCRAAMMALTVAGGVRRGWRCGVDGRSSRAAGPPARWRANHL